MVGGPGISDEEMLSVAEAVEETAAGSRAKVEVSVVDSDAGRVLGDAWSGHRRGTRVESGGGETG